MKAKVYFCNARNELIRVKQDAHPTLFDFLLKLDWEPVIKNYNSNQIPLDVSLKDKEVVLKFAKEIRDKDFSIKESNIPIYIDHYNCILFIRWAA